jgi:hypothetical protein
VAIYGTLIVGLLSLLAFLIVTKSPTDVTLLRALGKPFDVLPDGRVQNMLRLKITNRAEVPQTYRFVASVPGVEVVGTDGDGLTLAPGQMYTEPVQLLAAPELFRGGKLDVVVRVTGTGPDGRATGVERNCRLLGPHAAPATRPASPGGKSHVGE